MESNILKIKSRDDKILKIQISDLYNMESFMIKNLIEDTIDTSEIYIEEDCEIIKNILDSLRYKQLIFSNDVNLRLMYYVCDKWCVPKWLTDAINNELNASKKLTNINTFIDNLCNNI